MTTSNIVVVPTSSACSSNLSISGTGSPQFQICSDGACSGVVQTWGTANQTVTPGQYLQLRLTSSSSGSTTNTANLAVQSANVAWNVTTASVCTTPSISFTNNTGVALSTLSASNIVQASFGAGYTAAVTISGSGSPQFQICADSGCSSVVQTWGSSSQTVTSGQYLQMRLTSSSSALTALSANLVVGADNVPAWSVTTGCGTPSISFTNNTGVATSTLSTSNIVQVPTSVGAGCTFTTTISGSGRPQFQTCSTSNCSSVIHAWGSTSQTMTAGDYVEMRLTSSSSNNTVLTASLVVGSDNVPAWSVTTVCGTPSISFTNQTHVLTSTLTSSNIVQLPSSLGTGCTYTTTISGSGSPQFQICSTANCSSVVTTWGSSSQTTTAGQYLQQRLPSSASNNTALTSSLVVGSDNVPAWSVNTWLGYQRVFITSTSGQTNGGFGSVAAANTICANRATAQGFDGTWLAWVAITTGTNDPATTFTHPTTAYKLVDGTTTIANNWTGLSSGTLLAGISKDETGTAVTASTHVWTNVASNGTASFSGSDSGFNCTAWTNTGNGTHKGNYGLTSATGSTWTASSAETCSTVDRLYCIEQ